ncbi:amidase [Caballeronia sp. GAFFF2]|uniref:amidase n=1 Tax=Caballeronia sp. GAFFF2 TaxID=2921741 RepID=UPI002029055C|nr:amidase [Caballeronia sp. GAFFF2]
MTLPPFNIRQLAERLASGAITAKALVEESLAAIGNVNGEGYATFLTVDPDAALKQADEIDNRRRRNEVLTAFSGIPISVKDNIDVAHQQTRAGSLMLREASKAQTDAPAIGALRRAGFIPLGRTNMTEFAYSGLGLNPHYGTPRNPWDRETGRIPGGSSSGAAVSVADHMVPAAIGTDTGGSCRIPAALCGVVGFKPTARRVPTHGVFALSASLDAIGPLARSVDCCSVLFSLMSSSTRVPATFNVRDCRLAVPTNYVTEDMDPQVAIDFDRAISRLSKRGVAINEVKIPELHDITALNSKGGFPALEGYLLHRKCLENYRTLFDPRVAQRLMRGSGATSIDYFDLISGRLNFVQQMSQRFERWDALLYPTVPFVPPPIQPLIQDRTLFDHTNALALRNSTVVNLYDGCAVTLPIHQEGSAPVGMTVAGSNGGDETLLGIAMWIEKALTASM